MAKRRFARKGKVSRFQRKKRYNGRKKKVMYATPKMIYAITLQAPVTTFTVSSGTSNVEAFSWSFGEIVANDIDALMNLYDEIKITGVTVEIKPRGNVAQAGLVADGGFQYYTVQDSTDDNTLASTSEALEYANVRTHQSWRPMKRYVKVTVPKLLKDCNNNPLLTVEAPKWLQLRQQIIGGVTYNNAIVAHLGLKLITEVNEGDESHIFDVYQKYHCLFRNKI